MIDLDEEHILFEELNNITVPIHEVVQHIGEDLLPRAGATAIFTEKAKARCSSGDEVVLCDDNLQAQLSAALPVSNQVHAVKSDPDSEPDSGPPSLKDSGSGHDAGNLTDIMRIRIHHQMIRIPIFLLIFFT